MLTFVIPLISKHRCENWLSIQKCLNRTLNSLLNQDDNRWRAIIVSSEVLKNIPKDSRIINVLLNEKRYNNSSKKIIYGEQDKQNKCDMGLDYARGLESEYVMVLDADDCLHRNLNSYIHSNPKHNTYIIKSGYIYKEGSYLLFKSNTFDTICGSCFISKTEFAYENEISNRGSSPWVQQNCQHGKLFDSVKEIDKEPCVIPFRAAIYNIGRTDNLSRSYRELKPLLGFLKSPYRFLKSSLFTKKFNNLFCLEPIENNSLKSTLRALIL